MSEKTHLNEIESLVDNLPLLFLVFSHRSLLLPFETPSSGLTVAKKKKNTSLNLPGKMFHTSF